MPPTSNTPHKDQNPAPAAGKNPRRRPKRDPALAHEWVGAAVVDLTLARAKRVLKYQSFRAKDNEKIPVLDVYCKNCRRNMEDVTPDSDCSAKVNNEHLIGGDQRVRAKRKHAELPPGAVVMPGPRVNRYGIDAVIRGEA